jgi:hypothetical protein
MPWRAMHFNPPSLTLLRAKHFFGSFGYPINNTVMKKSCFSFRLSAVLAFLFSITSSSQISNYIYGIHNPSAGNFYFSRMDTASGVITDFSQVPISVIGMASSCIDVPGQVYYFCIDELLVSFDASSGNLLATVTLPIPPSAQFLQIQFNPCDSSLYGIINDPPSSISFGKYNLASGVMTTISVLSSNMLFCMGCVAVLDPDSGIYSFYNGNIVGLDISTGQTLYDNPATPVNFGHIALKCNTHEIFGISVIFAEAMKVLCTIDPYTGIVTQLSQSGWQQGLWKPAMGGDFINQASGEYYYVGAGVIMGISTLTGDTTYTKTGVTNFYLIQHFSDCGCSFTGMGELDDNTTFQLSPNPASSQVTIRSMHAIDSFEIYNLIGEKISSEWNRSGIGKIKIDVSRLNPGIYFVEVNSEKGRTVQKFIIKN